MIARRFVIHGRVQGVGFRYFTVRSARRHALRGWVRNAPDGTVEVCAAGEAEAIDALRQDLGRGPVASSVDRVEEWEAPAGALDEGAIGFDVRY